MHSDMWLSSFNLQISNEFCIVLFCQTQMNFKLISTAAFKIQVYNSVMLVFSIAVKL